MTPLPDSEIKRELVVMAHPDDCDFGAGGTNAQWTSQGHGAEGRGALTSLAVQSILLWIASIFNFYLSLLVTLRYLSD